MNEIDAHAIAKSVRDASAAYDALRASGCDVLVLEHIRYLRRLQRAAAAPSRPITGERSTVNVHLGGRVIAFTGRGDVARVRLAAAHWGKRFASLRTEATHPTCFAMHAKRVRVDPDTRSLALSFSSEQPVERGYGRETLSHARGAVNLTRLNQGAPLLFNHRFDDVLGVVESADVGNDRRGRALVRFAKNQRGTDVMGMVNDGILRNVSVQYSVDGVEARDNDDYLVTKWTPLEISVVTVPADNTIGIGRSAR